MKKGSSRPKDSTEVDVKIIDRAAPLKSNTFSHTTHAFLTYLFAISGLDRLDVIWDTYYLNNPKTFTPSDCWKFYIQVHIREMIILFDSLAILTLPCGVLFKTVNELDKNDRYNSIDKLIFHWNPLSAIMVTYFFPIQHALYITGFLFAAGCEYICHILLNICHNRQSLWNCHISFHENTIPYEKQDNTVNLRKSEL